MKCNGINLGHICSSSKENAYQLLVAAGGLGKKGLGPVQARGKVCWDQLAMSVLAWEEGVLAHVLTWV